MHFIADVGGTSSRWFVVEEGMESHAKAGGVYPVAHRAAGFIPGLDALKPSEVPILQFMERVAGALKDRRR